MNKRDIGSKYEQIAADFLERIGYTVLERNYRTKIGEIDIIAKEDGDICFIEVKYRKNLDHGYPSEAVDYRKQRNIIAVSNYYLLVHGMQSCSRRYDIVEIVGNKIRVLKNSFGG